MYVIELALRMSPCPGVGAAQGASRGRRSAVSAGAPTALEQGQPRLLELTCEKVEGKKVTLLISEVLAVQLYEKDSGNGWQQASRILLLSPECLRKAELRDQAVSHSWPNGQTVPSHRCSFTIPGPGLWMLVGSNGSGKSTLFRLIAGLLQPQDRTRSTRASSGPGVSEPRPSTAAPQLQQRSLLLGMPAHLLIRPRSVTVRHQLLDQLGLADWKTRPIHSLSGGQKQRLAIAGALASDAGLLLLDEPTALLDPDQPDSVLTAVNELCHRSSQPLTALWITHRLEELASAQTSGGTHVRRADRTLDIRRRTATTLAGREV